MTTEDEDGSLHDLIRHALGDPGLTDAEIDEFSLAELQLRLYRKELALGLWRAKPLPECLTQLLH